MPPEIITAAAGLLGRIAAEPAKAAAMRRAAVINALKKLHLDPNQPPKDFDSLYAYALVEELYGRPRAALRIFQDQYVQRSFARSFETNDWSHVQKEIELAVERNRETAEFGHLGVDVAETLERFTEKFQELVDRSRNAHHTRVENKIDTLLDEVRRTRSAEEAHRLVEEPARAAVSPAERLSADAQAWFVAVGYRVERTWKSSDDTSALIVSVPTRRPGRFDRVVVLCVDGELGLYHLELLERITVEEDGAEGWGVAQLRISEAARRKAAESEDKFSCFSFDELIDLEVDFEPYIEWLQNETKSRKIDTRYIPLSCQKEEVDPATGEPLDISSYHWQEGGLDRYVETWLTDPAKKHLSLLGEFGMGKSWFCLHFASKLAEAWRDAKERGLPRPRVPLVVPLRDYAKQTSVAALLSEFFFNKHKIGLRSYDVFSVLNRMGRLLLIFDGFDEMASRIDRNTMVGNFWELAKAVEPGAKVLLSSRTEHFPEAKEARDLFEARVAASPSVIPTDGPTFEIVELVPFDDTQIEGMLGHLLGQDKNKIKSVLANEHVRDLMRRPVMSELVIDALPEIESGAPVNLTHIYLYAIQRKMDRDVTSQRTFTSRADKLLFLSEVSWEMLRTNRLTLNYRDFPDRLRACFGSVVENRKDLDYWEQDMRNQGMLVRNAEGDYGPSHKSLLEFLTAYKYAAELGLLSGDFLGIIPQSGNSNAESFSWSAYFDARRANGSLPAIEFIHAESPEKLCESFGVDDFNPVVYDFLAAMTREHPEFDQVLIGHIKSTRDLANPESLGGNCANLLGLAQGTLEGADLRGVDLTGFRNPDMSQPRMSLIGANLQGAMLNSVNLGEIDKLDADFTSARLRKSRFLDSACRPLVGNIHPNGMVGALVIESSNDVEERKIFLWRDGDLTSPREEIQLGQVDTGVSYSWLRGARYFLGATADWWGYSDGTDSYIVSSDTGAILDRVAGCATRAITWEGKEALVCQDEESRAGFGWKIVDLGTHEIIAVIDDVEVQDATHFTYFDYDSGLQVWAKSSHETKIFQFTPGQSEWNDIGVLPVGKDDSVSRLPHVAQVMHDGQSVYMADRFGRIVAFEKSQVEPAMADLSQSERVALSREDKVVIISGTQRISVWDVKPGGWEKRWATELGGKIWNSREATDHSRLLVTCTSGELLIYSLQSGELISATSFNPHLKGARFSNSSDLRAEELSSARRAGAVVDGADST
ncbi:NACHT domain-containing protein [Streptomyces sp. MB09-02B]|uniref:NACHT domain-containing protein n=1 Tax=Streptomyces sp. MB09-02B TaxID=3028667 RepID=UPI0029AE3F46|nr:NACHT domain-containing protein [Streptomyces sp. MB09-02B]MDX3640928.1 NACHT domain-containing protein [Streptomyces sp. MB09-02B]